MRMHNPPHPGEVLRELCLRPLGVTVTHAATRPRRESEDPVGHPEWPRGHFPGDGHPLVRGLRHDPGELAESASPVRPLARRAKPEEPARPTIGCRLIA